ncbi:protein disulfide isomerase [Cryptosporidium canis]|nr:protein disulfide isomerase [Cryptosporidium canis]
MIVFPRRLAILIAVLVAIIGGVLCDNKIEAPAGVVELKDDTFDQFIEKHDLVLVLFYDSSETSRRIVQGLDEVVSGVETEGGKGKIAMMEYYGSLVPQRLFIRNPPKLVFFYGSKDKSEEYPSHLTGLERQSMISILLSKEDSVFVEYDSRNSESLEKAMAEFRLESKVARSNLPVLVYYGKPDTKRTQVVKNTLKKLRETSVPLKAFIIYVKYKADIGLHIYRLPESDSQKNAPTNPKELYVAKKRILGLLEWNENVLSVFVEACIRPYVSFKGNEIMYTHESTNSLIIYLKGTNTVDRYGHSNIKYLDSEEMESLRAVAKANFFPEDPDKDLLIGLVLPGLEQSVQDLTGFYRDEHAENGTLLLKLRTSKFSLENSGKTKKFLLPEDQVNKHGLKHMISQARAGKIPNFHKSKRIPKNNEVAVSAEQYLAPPHNYLELTPPTFMELAKDPNSAILVLYYSEMCSKCKDLLPLWKRAASEIASKLQSDSKFRAFIAVFDLELNDNPIEMEIEKIPIVYYFPFGDNKISNKVLYEEGMTLDAVTTFINDRIILANENNSQTQPPKSQPRDEL